jgi:hypothetical protein
VRPPLPCQVHDGALHPAAFFENSIHETNLIFGPFRSFQLQAESGGCVVLSGHLAAMMGPPGGPGGVVVGYPPQTPAQGENRVKSMLFHMSGELVRGLYLPPARSAAHHQAQMC